MSLNEFVFHTIKRTYFMPKNAVINADNKLETIVAQSGILLYNIMHSVIGNDNVINTVTIT